MWAVSLVVACGFLPLLVLVPAPLADWPSHLARVGIADQVLNGNPFWSERYQFNSLLIPNAVLDAVILGFMRLGLSIDQAGLAFLALCYGAFMFGFVRLSRVHGVPPVIAAASGSALFLTGNMVDGLLNYTAGIAASLIAFSFWCPPRASLGKRLAIALIATPLIMFCHIVAALVFAGVCACHDLFGPAQRWRDRLLNVAPASFALALGVAGYTLSAASGDNVHQLVYRNRTSLLGALNGKFHVVLEALTSGNQVADAIAAVLLTLFACLAWRARARISLQSAAPVAALTMLAMLAPNSVGDGSLLDFRLCILPLMFAMATFPGWGTDSGPLTWWYGAAALARAGVLAVAWSSYGPVYADLERQLAALPAGSTLLAAYGDAGSSFYEGLQPPLWNSASLATRYGIFVPSVFASATQQPLAVKPEWRPAWLWSHYGNARTPERLAALRDAASRLCSTDPNVFLFVLYSGSDGPASGQERLHGLGRTRTSVLNVCGER